LPIKSLTINILTCYYEQYDNILNIKEKRSCVKNFTFYPPNGGCGEEFTPFILVQEVTMRKNLYLRNSSIVLAALICAVYINSCDLPEGPNAGTRTGSTAAAGSTAGTGAETASRAGPGTLTLILPRTRASADGGASRHILPGNFIGTLKYRVSATNGSGGTVVVEADGGETTIRLQAGDWTIMAEAYVAGPPRTTVGSGSVTVTIVAGENVSQTISMTVDPAYEAALTDFYIHTEADLRRIGAENGLPIDDTRTFYLVNDIVLEQPWTPIGGGSDTPFRAVFDGQGKSITVKSFGGPILDGNAAALGFFAYTDGAAIEDLTIKYELTGSKDISTGAGSTYYDAGVGGVAGYASDTTFTDINVQVTGNFSVVFDGTSGLNVGGIAGQADNVTITGCHVTGTIAGTSANYLTIGGIAGNISTSSAGGGDISESAFVGTIDGNSPGGACDAGGITGWMNDVEITASFAEGSIKAQANDPRVGGIAGVIDGTSGGINESYARGTIESIASGTESNAGGIAGRLFDGTIENCYAWAEVSTSSVYSSDSSSTNKENAGGIAGTNEGNISKCYTLGRVKANGNDNFIYVGGIAGNTDGSISACMALVEELDGGPSTRTKNVYAISAVTASGTFTGSGNYSRNDITYKNTSNSPNFDFGAANKGGLQTPPANFTSSAFYSGPGWNFTAETGDWKFLPAGSNYDYPVLVWQDAAPGDALEEATKGGFEIEIVWP
jgi:hypothetical protein